MSNEVMIPDEELVEELMSPEAQALPSSPSAAPIEKKPKVKGDAASRATALMLRFRAAQDARLASGIEAEWREAEKLYMQEDDRSVEGDWRSDAFVPHATREVHNAVPHLVSAVLDAESLVSVRAVDPVDADYAACEQRLIEFQLEQKMQFPEGVEVWAKQAALLGTACAFVGFTVKTKTIKVEARIKVADGLEMPGYEDKVVPVDAHNTFIPLDITDIWVDPSSTPFNIPRLYYYERKSIRQIKAMGRKFSNLEKLTDSPMPVKEFFKSDFTERDGVSIGTRRDPIDLDDADLDVEDRLHHLMHEWDNEKKEWSIVADDDVEILPPTKYEASPFVFMWYEFLNTRFYGRGVVAGIAKSCRNANRLRRQRDDNVELAMNRIFITRAGAIADEEADLVWKPGNNVHVRGGSIDNAIKVLEMGDVTGSAYQDERIIKSDIEDVNGISPVAMGQGDSKSKTATGTSILRQMSVMRLRGPVRHMLQALLRVVKLMVQNNQKYISNMEKVHLLGTSARVYQMYKPDYAGKSAELSIHPASLYDNQEVKNAQLLNAVNILGNIGLLQMLDQRALVRQVLSKVGGMEDVDLLLTPSNQLFSAPEFMEALMESQMLVQGQPVKPQPQQNHQAHLQLHREFLKTNQDQLAPEESALLVQHTQAHEQIQQMLAQQQMMMAQQQQAFAQGVSSGGVQPQRLPSPTDAEDVSRTSGNEQGRPLRANEVSRA
jgi:hypothetical protein